MLPEAVSTDADGVKSVRYDNLIPLLIEAIKEQDKRAAQQQAEIERLKRALRIGESRSPARSGSGGRRTHCSARVGSRRRLHALDIAHRRFAEEPLVRILLDHQRGDLR